MSHLLRCPNEGCHGHAVPAGGREDSCILECSECGFSVSGETAIKAAQAWGELEAFSRKPAPRPPHSNEKRLERAEQRIAELKAELAAEREKREEASTLRGSITWLRELQRQEREEANAHRHRVKMRVDGAFVCFLFLLSSVVCSLAFTAATAPLVGKVYAGLRTAIGGALGFGLVVLGVKYGSRVVAWFSGLFYEVGRWANK